MNGMATEIEAVDGPKSMVSPLTRARPTCHQETSAEAPEWYYPASNQQATWQWVDYLKLLPYWKVQ